MATNSIRLLKAEVKREEAELAKERTRLEELEKNAKAAKLERKRQSKKVSMARPFFFVAWLAWRCGAGWCW
jgi:hypothetical protein